MRLLLDTHVLIWALSDTRRITPKVRALILDGRNDIIVSAVALFEIAARSAAARRSGPSVSAAQTLQFATEAGYQFLSLAPGHAIAVETVAPFHRDPFDRLLLAQAWSEGLQLVTHDESLAAFDPRTILL